jgi:hypothetical protein
MAWSVDRLGRSLQDLVSFLSELHARPLKLLGDVKDAPTRAMILRAAAEYDERAEQAERESTRNRRSGVSAGMC